MLTVFSPEEELAKPKADQLPQGVSVWVTHRFSHFDSSEMERASFPEAPGASGFGPEVGGAEEIAGDGYWHYCWAFTPLLATPETLQWADARARKVAGAPGTVTREDASPAATPRLLQFIA